VRCWGDNSSAELGIGASSASRSDPVLVALTSDVVAIAAGRAKPTACAVKGDGTIWCWGQNHRGSLGHVGQGDLVCTPGGTNVPCNGTPAPVPGFTGFASPTVSHVACANKDHGGFYCWGFNGYSQLGIGTVDSADHPTPAPVTTVPAQSLSAGVNHSCAIDAAGDAYCWGFNFWGEVGDGSKGGVSCEGGGPYCVVKAEKVKNISNVVAISAGGDITLALTRDGTVWAWGVNVDARLGHPAGATDGGAADEMCFPDAGGSWCSPAPSRVYGLP
jgi:alpha-tubulin suppressor-like RCC1 family protein